MKDFKSALSCLSTMKPPEMCVNIMITFPVLIMLYQIS